MKYKLSLFFIALILFTGCGKKNLTCEKKEKGTGYTYNEKYELIYNNNGVDLKKINVEMLYKFNELYTEEELKSEYSKVSEYCDVYNSGSRKIISCSSNLNKNVIKINLSTDVEKISDSEFEDIMYVTKDEINNIKDTKKLLKNVGYSCK